MQLSMDAFLTPMETPNPYEGCQVWREIVVDRWLVHKACSLERFLFLLLTESFQWLILLSVRVAAATRTI